VPRILEDGVIIVLVTPLKNDRSQDTASLRKLVSYYLQAGVNGFTALGEVSESPRLSETERSENLKEVMEQVNGRVPVVVGTSRESTQLAVEAAIWAEEQGASALMIAPPKNLKLRDNAILAHYSAISDAVSIPIVVQDEPESDHPYMSEDLLTKNRARGEACSVRKAGRSSHSNEAL
jgi:4-hydroxy-tetrahydrodipicolinate synthase